ncbi:MAG: hypothetical protein LQ342_006521 [Letrouitia transgressa]|nr:MAG: hypothetical protein LQ342_006521 [Letrouitia transgressa]
MHVAQVTAWDQAPKYISLPTPAPEPNEYLIKIFATGLHQVVRSRAAGKHYSVNTLPHVPGIDGVGTLPNGQTVYFSCFGPGGSFAEYITRPDAMVRPLPKGLDPVQTAALVNPAMSSWMALKARCENLPSDFNVLIMGATSASGRLAVSLARHFGASKVFGSGRNEESLKEVGLDGFVVLKDDPSETDWSALGHVDIILDYVYGTQAARLLTQINPKGRVQYVHVGSLGGTEMSLPGVALRGKDLVIRGSGPGAWSMGDMAKEIAGLLEALVSVGDQKVEIIKLEDVEAAWNKKGEGRMVFVP